MKILKPENLGENSEILFFLPTYILSFKIWCFYWSMSNFDVFDIPVLWTWTKTCAITNLLWSMLDVNHFERSFWQCKFHLDCRNWIRQGHFQTSTIVQHNKSSSFQRQINGNNEEYFCSECGRLFRVNARKLHCFDCKAFLHFKCSGIEESVHQKLTRDGESFYCPNCSAPCMDCMEPVLHVHRGKCDFYCPI